MKAPGDSHRPALLLSILAVAAVLRLLAARGELWLDEIWSLSFARAVHSPLQIFTAIHHDNNHYLNTLYLWLIPTSSHWVTYRLLSVGAGVITVWLAALLLRVPAMSSEETGSRGQRSLVGAVLIGGSYWLTLYASEARGYALAVCCAFAALYATLRFFEHRSWAWGLAAAAFSAVGFLAHLTYLEAFVGLVAWSAHRLWHGGTRGARWLGALALLHGVPVSILAWLYVVDLRDLAIGGGPQHTYAQVIQSALSRLVGGPLEGVVAGACALVCGALFVVALRRMWRSGSDLWVFFLSGVVVAPALMLIAPRPAYLAERYFLVSLSLMLLAFAWTLPDVARTLGAGRSRLLLGAVGLYLAANLWHVGRLIAVGRGSYLPALDWMAAHSDRRGVQVAGDQDLSDGMLVRFYSQWVPTSSFTYIPGGAWPSRGPEWILLSSQSSHFTPPPTLPDARGNIYELMNVFPSAEVSGFTWALYHNKGG